VYRRPPNRTDTYVQELLLDEPDLKLTLQMQPPGAPSIDITDGVTLGAGSFLLWYLFPRQPFEIGVFHDGDGRLVGHYVNLVRPSTPVGTRWSIEDLVLDVWLAPGAPIRILDEDELEEARRKHWVSGQEAQEARRALDGVLARIHAGDWPPEPVQRWPLDLVPALRLKRDSPGTYYSALIAGRIIAYGLYLMGVVSATSIGFAAFTDAFVLRGPGQVMWLATVGLEALLLLPLALRGRLPATRWPQPALTDERSLFIATLASGLAVLGVYERASWGGALLPVYGTLGVFSLIFAVCRVWFDRAVPVFALAGLIVTGLALMVLL
jgi:predicted RNA-binding protein associated with RNAse of E/G family